ncbi:MAG: hypothetical protein BIFFINMI_01923 [Phycisphaerae bacterium]|nr:hypothetical protein [Phycisphaerae bacterium]
MNLQPTTGELAWLVAVLLMLAAAVALRIRGLGAVSADGQVDPVRARMRWTSRLLTGLGLLATLGLIYYRDILTAGEPVCPIQNNYDSAVLFAAMTGGLLFYMLTVLRRRRSGAPRARSAVDLILLPLMIAATGYAILINLHIVPFRVYSQIGQGMWLPIHLASLVIGSLMLVYAAVAGAMYLLVDSALRRKRPSRLADALPSLERLETSMHHGVLWGFWLLTLAVVSGAFLGVNKMRFTFAELLVSPKVWVGTAAWALYALVLNVRMIPRFRGRRAAWFAIAGFGLIVLAYIIAQLLPMGR